MLLNTFAQERPFLLKVDYPDYVPKNNSFEVSVFSRVTDLKCHAINFYLLLDTYVKLREVTYLDDLLKKELEFSESNFHDFYGKAYQVKIDLDSLGLTHDTFFQLILEMDAYNFDELKVAFGYECFYENGKVEVFSSYDFLSSKNPLPIIPINFYVPQLKAGGSLFLQPNSFLNLRVDKDEEPNNLLIEFWASLNNYTEPFLKLVNRRTNDVLLSLYQNYNHIITFDEKEGEEYYSDCFVGKNSWNHYSIMISNENKKVDVYGNDILLFSFPINDIINLKSLSLQLKNSSINDNIDFDLLKVWRYSDEIEHSFLNKHYKNYSTTVSHPYLMLDFDDDRSLLKLPSTTSLKLDYNNISYSVSDAPIFSKAPELDVVVYGGFYSIEWSQKEISTAREFVLEKSFSGGEFERIYSVYAEDDLRKKYYFSDEKRIGEDIVYYRLRQINKGGSTIYSSVVKIGQVEQLKFDLEQNFPNPFNPETQITIEMLEQDEVEIYVYDLVGKKIKKLHEGSLSQGRHSFTFSGVNLPSGIYFFEAKTANSSVVRKMILAK